MAETRLQQIIAAHRKAAEADARSLDELLQQATATPAPRDFAAALQGSGLSVISEVKRRSPSAGDLNLGLNPAQLAQQYEAGGASCLSVLTDEDFFGGSVDDLQTARHAVQLPVLRKDFTVDERDIADARIMGADAVLLIVAALSDDELVRFYRLTEELGMTALFEVHDSTELARAAALDPKVVGVNQRNLHTFEIDYDLGEQLADDLKDYIAIAESGIRGPDDAARLAAAGFDAVLVGTSLVTQADPSDGVRALIAAGAS